MHAGEAAKTGGSVKKRPPRSACLWPLSLGTGLSPPLWRGTECGQDAGDPFAGGLCERLEIVGAVEGPLSHAGGPAVGRRPLRPVRLEPRAALVRLAALAPARVPQERHACLVLDEHLPHAVVQVGPLTPPGAPGAGPARAGQR